MPGTLCLTFDDLFVDNWVAARPIFDDYDARVTFCISHLHTATPAQIDGLQLLQSDGHEIACHTRTHPKLRPYLETHGLGHWLKHEIDADIAEHRALGFPARSFACPFHASTPETRTALATRFEVIRAAGPRCLDRANPSTRIYKEIPASRCLDNLGFADIQHRAFPGWTRQHSLLDLIADTDGTAVFTGHDIRARKSGPGFYSTYRQLRRLLDAATTRNITLSHLP
ncbi:MAG: polysaccharide deacetylase family protein [Pseudomonadota bacterium]